MQHGWGLPSSLSGQYVYTLAADEAVPYVRLVS